MKKLSKIIICLNKGLSTNQFMKTLDAILQIKGVAGAEGTIKNKKQKKHGRV